MKYYILYKYISSVVKTILCISPATSILPSELTLTGYTTLTEAYYPDCSVEFIPVVVICCCRDYQINAVEESHNNTAKTTS